MIALPGTLLDGASVQPLAAALGVAFQVELLGVEASFDAEIERLARLADEPEVWIGHSLGGIAALHLAARHPQRCRAVIVLAANLRPDGPLGPQRRAEQRAALHRGGMKALLHEQLAPAYGIEGDAALLDDLLAQADHIGVDRFEQQLHYAAERPGLLHLAHALDVPVLALSAADDPLCPPACGDEIVARTRCTRGSEARHHTLAGAGHLLPLLAPAWCAGHIRSFLDTLGLRSA